MPRTQRSNLLFWLGIIGILFFVTIAFIGTHYLFVGLEDNTDEENRHAGFGLLTCSPVLLIPSVLFLMWGLKGKRREKTLRETADYVKAYRRISISELAQKTGRTELKAEKMLLECIERNLLIGYIDRTTHEFFTKETMDDTGYGWKCPGCGAYNDTVFLRGEVRQCKYCSILEPGPNRHGRGVDLSKAPYCPRCGEITVYVKKYDRWFCETCEQYL